MKAAKRYLLVLLLLVLIVALWLSLPSSLHDDPPWKKLPLASTSSLRRATSKNDCRKNFPSYSFSDPEDVADDVDVHISPRRRREVAAIVKKRHLCRMETCFDVDKCRAIPEFKVYVYPIQDRISASYGKILTSIRDSRFYTADPNLACLFILAIDTLDRDIGSTEFVKNLQQKVNSLPTWNNGRNHIIFNLYSGTWPDYNEDLGFDFGEAILAKASFSVSNYRYGFDISLPLFPKDHPLKGGDIAIPNSPNVLVSPLFPALRKYTLVFKGKRYLSGIGSESRNSLYHLHNGNDVILLTTCKHGKQWKIMKDDRCDIDNSQYDKFDYQTLLHNSTFCLVPRGRRLGSFRFLEALQAGCIPVLLSNGWVLPFSEVVDWNKAAIWADERLIFQVPSIVRSLSPDAILTMRRQTLFLWSAYFASIEKIALTSIETVRDRIFRQTQHQNHHWNMHPGGLHVLPDFADDLKSFPFYHEHHHHHDHQPYYQNSFNSHFDSLSLTSSSDAKFTAIIFARSMQSLSSSAYRAPGPNNSPQILDPRSSLFKLIKNVQISEYCEKILILWPGTKSPRLPPSTIPIVVITDVQSVSSRFYPYAHLQTSAVLSLDEDVFLSTEEIDFAFRVWTQFPQRIVGFSPRNHFWDDSRSRWCYTSKWANHYSMILTHAAFYHRYYHYLYTHSLRSSQVEIVESSQLCEDMLMNFLVSHVTRLPPIKVAQRKSLKDVSSSSFPASSSHGALTLSSSPYNESSFSVKQACFNEFVSSFGYMPLIRSSLRLDPVLFKDQVSTRRKKYKKLESLGP